METILRAAIRWKGRTHHLPPPKRHHDVIARMGLDGYGPESVHNQGFLTSEERFVGRVEGMKIARLSGQIKPDRDPALPDELFSEDLW